MRNNLIIEFLEVLELGYGSREEYNHLNWAVKKLRGDLLTMDSKNEEQMGCDLATNVVQESNNLSSSEYPYYF